MTNEQAMRMALAARRLRDALQPVDEVEDHDLACLCQVLRVEVVERLAAMAENRSVLPPPLRPAS